MGMKKGAKTLEQIKIPEVLQKNITFHSSFCEKHTYRKNGEDVVKPVQKMVINGQVVCPRCEIEKEDQRIQALEQQRFDELEKKIEYNVLYHKSILADNTILNADFDSFLVECEEERNNKNLAIEVADRLKNGQIFNTVLQGKQGTGKSHLAYSILREVNELKIGSCLFVSADQMLRMIKDSFNNKESKYTEKYFVDLLSNVTFLALDDIGAETGAIDTDKTATDFVQRVLYAITTTRQDKATIITTNLSSKTLFKMYDSKLVSRLFKNPKYILFNDSKDKRMSGIPF